MFAVLKKKRCYDTVENRENLKMYGKYTDKLGVKSIVESQNLDNLHIAKVHGIYNSYDEIDPEKLPNQFVIKANHWCGDKKIILSKDMFEKTKESNKKYFHTILKQIYGCGGEPHYKYIEPKIFIEEYLGNQPIEYKIHCIYGKVVCILSGDIIRQNLFYFNRNLKQLNICRYGDKFTNAYINKPDQFDKMIDISELLASNFDYVRIDLYLCNNQIYFGEYTFTPSGCNKVMSDSSFEQLLLEFLEKKNVDYEAIDKFLV